MKGPGAIAGIALSPAPDSNSLNHILDMHINELKNKARGKRDGGKPKSRPSKGVWTCSTPQQYCTGKFNIKVNSQGHGSREDVMRCHNHYQKLFKQFETGKEASD